MRQFLTIDTGGTKTRIVQFENISNIKEALTVPVLKEVDIPTPRGQDEYIATVASTIKQNFPEFCESPETNVVILATAGIIKKGVLAHYRSLDWYNFDMSGRLSAELGGMKVNH